MNATLVKICGITNLEDALLAIELGADYLGFNFYPDSPRFIPEEEAREIFQEIPPNIPKVGVFVNEEVSDVLDLAIDLNLDVLQFHGDESPEELNPLGRPWYKAFRLKDLSVVESISQYDCDLVLLDAYSEKAYGGTGQKIDFELVEEVQGLGKKIILAGGLNEQNIASAVARIHPYMVDVASGVEINPREKDPHKMKLFIERAKQAKLSIVRD